MPSARVIALTQPLVAHYNLLFAMWAAAGQAGLTAQHSATQENTLFAFPKMRPTPAGSHSRWRKVFRLKNQPLRSLRPTGCKAWLTKNLETLSHSVDPLQQGYALLVTPRWFKALMHFSSCHLSMSGYFATRSGTSNKSKTVFWIC